jgi:hypothetical protein
MHAFDFIFIRFSRKLFRISEREVTDLRDEISRADLEDLAVVGDHVLFALLLVVHDEELGPAPKAQNCTPLST